MDYATLIDDETWAFIRRTGAYYPEDTTRLTIADQRRIYDRMCRAFFQGYPQGVAVRDADLNGVTARIYQTSAATGNLLYLHGGGFILGGLDSHDDVCAEICAGTGLRVICPDYRLAPEHKHPAAFDDALTSLRETARRWPGPIVLAGDSAGANLAAAIAHASRGEISPAGQVLIYGGFGGDVNAGTYLTHANAPLLTRDDILFYGQMRYHGPEPANDPTAAPLRDTDFTGLPPSVLISAECDPLAGDSAAYGKAINAAGGKAIHITEPGLVHGYLRARTSVSRARTSFDRIIAAIGAFARGTPFPPDLRAVRRQQTTGGPT